jgi:dinuclear metal center YbgI/SA1388 family protein
MLATVLRLLDSWFDPGYAESWDAVGLVTGDPADEVTHIHIAVDATEAVAAEALERGAQLLLAHHPLFLRGVHGVPATTAGGRVVRTLLGGGCALQVAHTNADVASPGVSDALLRAVGVPEPGRILRPSAPLPLTALVVHVPVSHAAHVLDAVTHAGAGRLGDYDSCAFTVEGTGQFRPLAGSAPFLGTVGSLASVPEARLELVVAPSLLLGVLAALRSAHPYEEPSFWSWPLEVPSGRGLGRVGELPAAVTLAEFMRSVAAALPATACGIRGVGHPSTPVRTVAVVGGSGSDLVGMAAAAGADVLVTADTKHHAMLETVIPVVDVGHWASEWPWCAAVAGALRQALGDEVTVSVSSLVTDPWTLHQPSPTLQNRSPT